MIFCNLGSGSRGNCTYLQHQKQAILIDQGFTGRNLLLRCTQAGLDLGSVGAILVTHEHSDHVNGVGVVARRFGIPVYMTAKTRDHVPEKILRNIELRLFGSGDTLTVEDIRIKTFHIPHDAADPIGLVASAGGQRVGILTDLGTVSQSVLFHIDNLDLLFLESNHDMFMLLNGPYPLRVIQRIKSRVGHLSNDQSVELFRRIGVNGSLRYLVLGHLSESNNDPEVVRDFFEEVRRDQNSDFHIEIATQNHPMRIIHI